MLQTAKPQKKTGKQNCKEEKMQTLLVVAFILHAFPIPFFFAYLK